MNTSNKLVVSGFGWAHRHKRDFAAVITIEDPDKRYGIRFHSEPHPEHLILRFVDVDFPLPEPHCFYLKNRMADDADIRSAIEFSRGKQSLLIHCQAGVGRSTAICYAVLCDRYGVGNEENALKELLLIQPHSVPNKHVIALADKILERNGKMIETIDIWDRSIPENSRRRELNRKCHLFA